MFGVYKKYVLFFYGFEKNLVVNLCKNNFKNFFNYYQILGFNFFSVYKFYYSFVLQVWVYFFSVIVII